MAAETNPMRRSPEVGRLCLALVCIPTAAVAVLQALWVRMQPQDGWLLDGREECAPWEPLAFRCVVPDCEGL